MIDAFKNLAAGSKREVVVSERHELEQLIQTARAERAGMDAALVSLRERSASLTPIARSLEHLTQTMTDAATKLEAIGERLTALDGRTRELEQVGGQIQDLQDAARQAEQSFREGPDSMARRGSIGRRSTSSRFRRGRRMRVLALSKMSTRRSRNCEASCALRKPSSSNRWSAPARSTTSSSSFAG